MPATSKAALLSITQSEYDKLSTLVAPIHDAEALRKDTEDTSIKDVIAHRAHWIDLFLGWYREGLAGQEVHFPAPGYKWNQLKAYNADLRSKQADLGWNDAKAELVTAHTRLMALLTELPETALYGGPMKGARNAWTTGRWAEAAGASHYRSASKYIRTCLRDRTAL